MHLENQIPILIFHILKADISQYSRIVDQYVYPSKILDGCLNYRFAVLNAVVVGDGLSAFGFNFFNYCICGLVELC